MRAYVRTPWGGAGTVVSKPAALLSARPAASFVVPAHEPAAAAVYHRPTMARRAALLSARPLLSLPLWALACAGPQGPGPQEASFPPGQRVATSGALQLSLASARYDMQTVQLDVTLRNAGDTPLLVLREGILLAYNELEFPVSTPATSPLAAETTIPAGGEIELAFQFVIEQALIDAGTLHVMSIREGTDGWLQPLQMAVPPPAAFVDAAEPAPEP